MKKALYVAIPFLCIIVAVYLMFFNTFYITTNIVENEVVENQHNNAVSCGVNCVLSKSGDKLYYNYNGGNSFKNGLYEISSNKTKRIYTNGIKKSPELTYITVYKDKLLNTSMNTDNHYPQIECFNTDKQCFEKYLEIPDNTIKSFEIIDGRLYMFSDNSIFYYENNKTEKIFDLDEISYNDLIAPDYYINDKFIYYFKFQDGKNSLVQYDYLSKEKKEYTTDFSEFTDNNYQILADENFALLFVSEKGLYLLDLKSGENNLIYKSSSQYLNINMFNESIYVIDDGTLYFIDMSGEKIQLAENAANVCIVDSKWVYYTDNVGKDCLYRITADGQTVEKVFG